MAHSRYGEGCYKALVCPSVIRQDLGLSRGCEANHPLTSREIAPEIIHLSLKIANSSLAPAFEACLKGGLVFILSLLPVLGSCGPFWAVTPCIPLIYVENGCVLSPSPVRLGRLPSVHPPAWGGLSGTSPDGAELPSWVPPSRDHLNAQDLHFRAQRHLLPVEGKVLPAPPCGREGAPSTGSISAQAPNPS